MPEELIITLYCISLSGGRIPLSGFTSLTEPVDLENVLEEFAGEWVSPYGAMTVVMPSCPLDLFANGAGDIESYGLFLLSSLVALSTPEVRDTYHIAIQDQSAPVPGEPIGNVYEGSEKRIVLSQLQPHRLALTWIQYQEGRWQPLKPALFSAEDWISAAKTALHCYIDFLENVLLPYHKEAGVEEDDYFGINRQIELGRLLLAH